ncbi:MAG: type II toxin-antitoxin system MqsA family antitoxin [Pseudoflavonifractor sp.]
MNCFFCKSDMTEGFTTHVVDMGKCIVIVKHVPCMKCAQCGQVVYTGTVAKALEKIVHTLEVSLTEIAVVNYPGTAA